jgi:hypothetical protein
MTSLTLARRTHREIIVNAKTETYNVCRSVKATLDLTIEPT